MFVSFFVCLSRKSATRLRGLGYLQVPSQRRKKSMSFLFFAIQLRGLGYLQVPSQRQKILLSLSFLFLFSTRVGEFRKQLQSSLSLSLFFYVFPGNQLRGYADLAISNSQVKEEKNRCHFLFLQFTYAALAISKCQVKGRKFH